MHFIAQSPVVSTTPCWQTALIVLERVVLDVAALATVVAVWFAYKALRDSASTAKALDESLEIARADRLENVRGRAALVLQHADLLARRLKSIWHDGFAYDVGIASEQYIDRYLPEVEQDIKLAEDLLDRASRVDPEVTAYAELVWRKVAGIRLSLRLARRFALAETAVLTEQMKQRQMQTWGPYRQRILENATQAIELLERIDKYFPAHAVKIKDSTREDFLKATDKEVESAAKARVVRLLKEVTDPGSTA